METLCLPVSFDRAESRDAGGAIARAAAVIRAGGLVAFPTETVYGLGANALDAGAVRSIFAAKQRPAWDPVIVHIAATEMLAPLLGTLDPIIASRLRMLQDAFWPGPLTLLLPRSGAVPDAVTAGRELVGVRWPSHPVAQALIRSAGIPLAAPSANRFGHTSPTTAGHVLDDLSGRIDLVLDAGPCEVGVESTVLDVSAAVPMIYRPGGVTLAEISRALQCEVELYRDDARKPDGEALPAPGTGIRHYAPSVPVRLVKERRGLEDALHRAGDGRLGVMLPTDWAVAEMPPHVLFAWGDWNDAAQLSQRLYRGLRTLEASGVDEILCPMPAAGEATAALRDRLHKASMPR